MVLKKESEEYSQSNSIHNSFVYKLNYKTISGILTLRNKLYSPESILKEINIEKGMKVLDFGCGPGHFSLAVSKIVTEGQVYAVDKEDVGLKMLTKQMKKEKIKNISVINSDCKINLPDESVDVILLYYVFNDLKNKYGVLRELHRVLKPNGVLSFFEFNQNKISRKLQKIGFFNLEKQEKKTHTFVKGKLLSKIPESNQTKLKKNQHQISKKAKDFTKNNLMLTGVLTILGFSIVSPLTGLSFLADADFDGQINPLDNCPTHPNPDQLDFDFDDLGDICDLDDDNDGINDDIDAFDTEPTEWSDFDSDFVGDNKDTDDDNDGVPDLLDQFDTDPLRN